MEKLKPFYWQGTKQGEQKAGSTVTVREKKVHTVFLMLWSTVRYHINKGNFVAFIRIVKIRLYRNQSFSMFDSI